MADRKQTGIRGEALAAAYLCQRGYVIESTNYRYRRTEIDLIARQDDLLVFIEVKTRTSGRFGHPSRFFLPAQQRRMSRAASMYMEEVGHEWEIRFDLVTVLLLTHADPLIEHFEDVFFPGLF